jgi:hypothetical protein
MFIDDDEDTIVVELYAQQFIGLLELLVMIMFLEEKRKTFKVLIRLVSTWLILMHKMTLLLRVAYSKR